MHSGASTLIYAHGGGRFGNQLLRFFHWLAWSIHQEKRARVISLPFWPYSALFEHWAAYPGCAYPDGRGADWLARVRNAVPSRVLRPAEWRMQRMISAMAGRLPGLSVASIHLQRGVRQDLTDSGFNAQVLSRRRTVCSGWEFTCWPWLERHADQVRQLFAPVSSMRVAADHVMDRLRRDFDTVVGLFIRRGDYQEWRDGRFFFPIESYVQWAREIVEIHGGSRTGILVTSDEVIAPEAFRGLPVEFASGSANLGGHWFESFLELAACDVVVSPPSTFSACATFLGNRPLWPLSSPDQRLAATLLLHRNLFDAAGHVDFSIAVR